MARDDEAFLAAILAHPDDDLPRLVYADWLEERGDPRGEFIRLHCKIASEIPDRRHRAQHPAHPHLGNIYAANRAAWEGNLSDFAEDWTYVRGFIEDIKLSAAAFVARGDELFARFPIRGVELTNFWEEAEAIAKSPLLGSVVSLDVSGRLLSDEASSIVGSQQFRKLERLSLDGTHCDGIVAGVLAANPALAGLRRLSLDFTQVGSSGVHALTRSPHLDRLTMLLVGGAGVGPEGIDALIERPGLPSLTDLCLHGNPLGGRGVRRLAERPIGGLAKLCLTGVEMSDHWRERIAAQYSADVTRVGHGPGAHP